MKSKMIVFASILVSMMTTAFALQCPSKFDLARSPGQNSTWVLNDASVKKGWHEVGVYHSEEYPQPIMVNDLFDPRIKVTATAAKKHGDYYTYRCDYEFATRVPAPGVIPPVNLVAWAAVEYDDYAALVFNSAAHKDFILNNRGVYQCTVYKDGDCQF